jgi:ribonuclease HI
MGPAFPGVTDPSVLETMACREALSLADDLNIRNISISSDCQGALTDIVGNMGSTNAAIAKEINEYERGFGAARFTHERRHFVTGAQNLGKAACSLDQGHHLWLTNPANCVLIPITISNITDQ